MKKSSRMQRIADINKNYETAATASYVYAQKQYDEQCNQLKQLEIYRDEYKERYKHKISSSISTTEINDFRFFFSSLEDAIQTQKEVITEMENKMRSARNEWISKHNETEKMQQISNKHKSKEAAEDLAREMKDADELNQTLYNYHNLKEFH